MKALLPYLFILICPLIMVFMIRGMHGHGSHKRNSDDAEAQDPMSAAELGALRDDLKVRMDQIDARIDGIVGAEPKDGGLADTPARASLWSREDVRGTEST